MKNAQRKIITVGPKAKKGKTPSVSKKATSTPRRTKSLSLQKTDPAATKYAGIKEQLIKEKEALLQKARAELSELVGDGEKYSGISDEGDLAKIIYEDSVAAAKAARFNNRITAIDAALATIADGTYGICEDCGEQISQKRLEILPFALCCVGCQEEKETGKSHEKEDVLSESKA